MNPAIQLGIDSRVGSIDVGKDADLAIYNHDPLSVYAVVQKTLIDGQVYFDRQKDIAGRAELAKEKQALLDKEKKAAEEKKPEEKSEQKPEPKPGQKKKPPKDDDGADGAACEVRGEDINVATCARWRLVHCGFVAIPAWAQSRGRPDCDLCNQGRQSVHAGGSAD